jgi:hypothetical protein
MVHVFMVIKVVFISFYERLVLRFFVY